ncbi:CapA family protein [Streptomyces sp. AJS327]|uniref:CapA family protein n=1 Tax=Streptomyces sp. AJS327 TaxID=2545265 RepID=UPI0015E007A6|nr:CapA family protein [Streptomyces sp. AJS327]MBA0051529.1 CapA family protein [Streptomyces sp. AJS327]
MNRPARRCAAVLAAALLATVAGCGVSADPPRSKDPEHGGNPVTERARARSDAERAFTLLATGDLLVHDSIIRQAKADARGGGYDFRRILSPAKPLATRADLAICHMETVYGPDGGPFSGYPAFETPPQLAASVRATGYDSCSTASNHTLDAGAEGVSRTLRAMGRAGLRHVGSARSETERTRPAVMRAGGATVAQLAYTYGTNGIPVPRGKPWLVNLIDPDRIIADARAARRAGADVVVASLHWGTEWQEAPDARQRSVARRLTASRSDGRRDIDLILGTHAHVPQAYEKVNGTWVVYGMGDQIAGKMNDPRGTMGSAARFTFAPPKGDGDEWRVTRAGYTPFLMETSPRHRLINLAATSAGKSGKLGKQHGERAQAYRAIRKAVLSRGAARDGLRMLR